MSRRHSRRQLLLRGLAHTLGVSTIGCGTILHPERRGQPAGQLDWGVVALDAVGLLFFFVPGVIAFAVDFSTGAIYLPRHRYSRRERTGHDGELVRVEVPREQLTPGHVERVATDHAGKPVRLRPNEFESRPMEEVDDFWTVHDAVLSS